MVGSAFYKQKMTLARRISTELEKLTIGQGSRYGERMKLFPWERRFLNGAFKPGVEDAALSIARGNGKSTFLAGILTCGLGEGPLVEPGADIVMTASSFEQGRICFAHLRWFLEDRLEETLNGSRRKRYRVQDSANRAMITDTVTRARVVVTGSDPRRLHGLAPKLILGDELAQWPKPESMLAALRTSLGKIPGARSLWIGTRPEDPAHPFEKLLLTGDFSQLHSVPKDREERMLFWKRTWTLANPSLRFLPDLERTIRKHSKRAKEDAGELASFRSLRLNQGVSDVANRDLLCDPAIWKSALDSDTPPAEGPYALGVDMGGSAAFSSLAACWGNGRLDTVSAIGGIPSIRERARKHGVGTLYDRAVRSGELLVEDGKRIPSIPTLFDAALERWGEPEVIVTDPWRLAELEDALEGHSYWRTVRLSLRRQGFKDGAAAVRAWKAALLDSAVHPVPPAIMLTRALAEAVTVADPAGNQKLAKSTQGGRRLNAKDDVAAASLLAVEASKSLEDSQSGSAYGGVIG